MRQFRGQRGQREARLGGGAGGDNAQRHGQPRTLVIQQWPVGACL
jgi:hypothetical protein